MTPNRIMLQEGDSLFREGTSLQNAYLLLDGKIRYTRTTKDGERLLGFSLMGELIAWEVFYSSKVFDFSAEADTDCMLLEVSKENFRGELNHLPEWLSEWFHFQLLNNQRKQIKHGMDTEDIYSICNLLHAFLRIMDLGANRDLLKGSYKQVTEEMAKSLPRMRAWIKPILKELSEIGLIDLRDADPMNPYFMLPDQKLYLAFLHYLQVSADLPEGMHEYLLKLNPIELTNEAGALLDAMLTDPELSERMFEPERSMVHLHHNRLNDLFQTQYPGTQLDSFHPCLAELEQHGAFTRIVDNQEQSVFANMRNILRINMLRDPNTNFADITEFLCEKFAEMRQNLFDFI